MSLTCAHLDGFLAAGLTAEQIVALVKTDIEEREKATGQRRAKDRERQKRHRESRGVTVTNAESAVSRGPPKENKSKPQSSEANASGGAAADPAKLIWDLGVEVLTDAGCSEKQARSLIGKWRKDKSDGEVVTGLLECRAKAISEPVAWLTKRFEPPGYVSASGYHYRGDADAVMREAEKRADWGTYWKAKSDLDGRVSANG